MQILKILAMKMFHVVSRKYNNGDQYRKPRERMNLSNSRFYE